jgi:D-glycero-D-manno-heptose 1,7-bisphosphate phosphatase
VTSRFKTVFVDRDGTLNQKATDGEYIASPDDLHLIEGVGPAVRRLNKAGIPIFVITNQRGVARGIMSTGMLDCVNAQLTRKLAQFGASVDGIYTCPHEIDACDCRKPKPGLLLQCASEHPGLDFSRSVVIGDVESDIAAGLAVGAQAILVADDSTATAAQHVVRSFCDAIEIVLDEDD